MYTIFFAAFVLMVLTVFSNTESGGDRLEAQNVAAANSLAKPATRREHLLVALVLAGVAVAALVGLYLHDG